MADRVKYFLLGLLFLVVAGVIAFDRWNSREVAGPGDESARTRDGEAELWFDPPASDEEEPGGLHDETGAGTLQIDPPEETIRPEPKSKELDLIPPPIDPKPEPRTKPKPAPKPAPVKTSDTIHVVRSGETLGEIAQHYYPGRVQAGIRMIVAANQIANPNHIRENDKLVIPASSVRRPSGRPTIERTPRAKAKSDPKPGIPSTYLVRKNDGDLYAILRRFYGRKGEGARVVRVMELNNLVSTRVPAGTKLKLPPK